MALPPPNALGVGAGTIAWHCGQLLEHGLNPLSPFPELRREPTIFCGYELRRRLSL